MNVKFKVKHFLLDAIITTAKFRIGKVNCANRFDRSTANHAPVARRLRVFAKQFDFVTDQSRRQHGITIDPDFSIVADTSNLHPNFISVSDDHH